MPTARRFLSPRYLVSSAAWYLYAAYLRAACRVWLNRAWMRCQDCLVADLEAISKHNHPASQKRRR